VTGGGKLRERTTGENLDVVGMRMNREDVFFHESGVRKSG